MLFHKGSFWARDSEILEPPKKPPCTNSKLFVPKKRLSSDGGVNGGASGKNRTTRYRGIRLLRGREPLLLVNLAGLDLRQSKE